MPNPSRREVRGVTVRALLMGSFLSFYLSIGAPYSNMVMRGSWMALDFNTAGALFLFFLLVGVLNVVLKVASRHLGFAFLFSAAIALPYLHHITSNTVDFSTPGMILVSFLFFLALLNLLVTALGKSLSLNRDELIVVYIMLVCASALSTMGLSEQLLPIITGVFYYATPENDWAEIIHPYIPDWITLPNRETIQDFYEGMPEDASIPWAAWMQPLMYWALFLVALYVVMVCLSVIVRKQWMERERLIYPIAQVPLGLIEGEDSQRLINRFYKNPVMWAGFGLPLFVGILKGLHFYFPFVPTIPLSWGLSLFRRTTGLSFSISFPMVGFSYLINSDIAAGIWFFHLLAKVQKGILGITGLFGGQPKLIYGVLDYSVLAYQGFGALIVMVGFGLWVGREHFKAVFRKAFTGDPSVDDSGEILSYRTAAFGMILGLIGMSLWLWRLGLPLWVAIFFVVLALLIFLAMTRIVAEGGVAVAVPPNVAPQFIVDGFGSSVLGPGGLITAAFTFVWAADTRTFVMATLSNGLKLTEGMHRRNPSGLSPSGRSLRYVLWAVVLAIVIGICGSIWMILTAAYRYGGINLSGWFFNGAPKAPFNYILPYLNKLTKPNGTGWISMGVGGAVMVLLTMARQRLIWWPLHPIGFPIGATWIMDSVWFSVFVAWLIKVIILKYWGATLYRKSRPFFLGLIAGQFFVNGLWLVVDYFTGRTDNSIFWI